MISYGQASSNIEALLLGVCSALSPLAEPSYLMLNFIDLADFQEILTGSYLKLDSDLLLSNSLPISLDQFHKINPSVIAKIASDNAMSGRFYQLAPPFSSPLAVAA